jgi:DNA mismatch repair protein MutH
MAVVSAPRSEHELLERARDLAGRTLGQLAARVDVPVPPDTLHGKGFAGGLLERCLGATAGSRALPDFEALGVELKTLPLDTRGQPLESTFVCTIALTDVADVEWEQSRVRHKLARVLWVPILSERRIPLAERTVGAPVLWSPSASEEADLRWDWEELSGLIARGHAEDITGHLGRYLQVRPKAANSRARRLGFDADGVPAAVLPRGFYLRTQFTARLLAGLLPPGGAP